MGTTFEMREICPSANEMCRWYDRSPSVTGETSGCFTDVHHYYSQRQARDAGRLAMAFINLPEHKERMCRRDHEEYEFQNGWLPLPTPVQMREVLDGK